MKIKYTKNKMTGITVRKNGFNLKLTDKIINKDISICLVETETGRDNYCMLDKSTMFYYIISGEGKFIIEGEECEASGNYLVEILPQNKYTW